MSRCSACHAELIDSRCPKCYGAKCRTCRKPICRDESYQRDALGVCHIRCAAQARTQPAYMTKQEKP